MKRLLYAVYVLVIVIVLIPKEKLYFTFESILSENHIFISGETIANRLLYLDADEGALVLDNQKIASIENIRITPWIFFNRLAISTVSVSPAYRTFFPGVIDEIVLTYSLLHPLSIEMQGEGDFGQCSGTFDLLNQKVRVVFDATPELRNYPLLVFKLHQEQGGLVYESDF